ncbi:MAG: 16S rRNA processing protein RimM [candidate division Zixibacteria bacterium]|nr:16S rRNA processing protein RimM [candidate division Zixibacteria bacterium]
MSPKDDTLIALGHIQKPRGLRGELTVLPYQADSINLRQGLQVLIKANNNSFETTIEDVKHISSRLGVKLKGIDNREAAEVYKNGELFCKFCFLPKMEKNEIYVFDLIGLKIIDDNDEGFGTIIDVRSFTANDLLVIESQHGEILVPMVKQFIDSISIDEGFVKIKRIREFIIS